MKRLFGIGLCLVVCVVFMTGCGEKQSKKKIGVVLSTLSTQYALDLKEGIEKKASEYGMDVVVLDSDNNSSLESTNIGKMEKLGVDAVIIEPIMADKIPSGMKSLSAAGKEIVIVGQSLPKDDEINILTTIVPDDVNGGSIAGKYLLQMVGSGTKVVELEGPENSRITKNRRDGFHEVIDGEMNSVITKNSEYDRSISLETIETLLINVKEFDAVFAHNDELAIGAAEALQNAGKTNVKVIGMDATTDGIAAVQSGKIDATIAKRPVEIGSTAVTSIRNYYNGTSVSKEIKIDFELIKG